MVKMGIAQNGDSGAGIPEVPLGKVVRQIRVEKSIMRNGNGTDVIVFDDVYLAVQVEARQDLDFEADGGQLPGCAGFGCA